MYMSTHTHAHLLHVLSKGPLDAVSYTRSNALPECTNHAKPSILPSFLLHKGAKNATNCAAARALLECAQDHGRDGWEKTAGTQYVCGQQLRFYIVSQHMY